MTRAANPARGEAAIRVQNAALLLRPTFAALSAAEGELGPLFALVERASDGRLSIREMALLFWHCVDDRADDLSVDQVGDALIEAGMVATTPALKALIGQILLGQ